MRRTWERPVISNNMAVSYISVPGFLLGSSPQTHSLCLCVSVSLSPLFLTHILSFHTVLHLGIFYNSSFHWVWPVGQWGIEKAPFSITQLRVVIVTARPQFAVFSLVMGGWVKNQLSARLTKETLDLRKEWTWRATDSNSAFHREAGDVGAEGTYSNHNHIPGITGAFGKLNHRMLLTLVPSPAILS